jgi:hypothetical protein
MSDELTSRPEPRHHPWPERALERKVVQALFSRFAVRYGKLWTSRLNDDNIDLITRDWAIGLAGFSFDAIKWGLENLPDDRPPLLGEFKAVCARVPTAPPPPRIAAPPADPQRVAAELRRMADMQAAMKNRDRLQWAYDLAKRDRDGDQTLTPVQRLSYQAALASLTASVADFAKAGGMFTPIPDDLLPAKLRRALERERTMPPFIENTPKATTRRKRRNQPEARP